MESIRLIDSVTSIYFDVFVILFRRGCKEFKAMKKKLMLSKAIQIYIYLQMRLTLDNT